MIDTVELSSAATRGTEAPKVVRISTAERLLHRLLTGARAQRMREQCAVLGMIAPRDVHIARTVEGLTAIERFCLTEACA